jgi:hypothetical protein
MPAPVGSPDQPYRASPSSAQICWIVGIFFVALFYLCLMGYGSDNDIYGMIESGYSTWRNHVLSTSRHPGYWTYEALIYVLSSIGGYVFSNICSLLVGCVVLWRFLVLAGKLRLAHPLLMCVCLAVTPLFAIASTTTMDYVWSLATLILAAEAMAKGRLVAAALLFALVINLRASDALIIAGGIFAAIAFEIYGQRRFTLHARNLIFVGLGAVLLGCPTYVLSWHVAGNSMEFAAPMIGPPEMWTMKMRVGRFVYKILLSIGPLACLISAIVGVLCFRRRPVTLPLTTEGRTLIAILCGYVVGNLFLFFKFPVEISYLVPDIFCFLLLAGRYLFVSRTSAVLLLLAILSLNFVQPQFAAPNIPGHATGAHLHFSLQPGQLLSDVTERGFYIGCMDEACWNDRYRSAHSKN